MRCVNLQGTSGIRYCCGGTAFVCVWFYFFCCKHCFHWLFSKCRAGTSGYDGYSFAWVCFYGTLFIGLAVAIEGARDMAGGSFGGNTYFFSNNGNLLS